MLAWQQFSEWRLAQKLWQVAPAALLAERQRLLQPQLVRQLRLEQAVADAARRRGVVVPQDQRLALKQALASELQQAGIAAREHGTVIQHHALMEAQLAFIATQAALPTAAEIEQWYQRHAVRFLRPEQRLTRHILLTAEEDDSAAVKTQLLVLHTQLQRDSSAFASLAERHSQCPSALEGGLLGWVSRGLLFTALEQTLFTLDAGALSTPVVTELGWHLLLCEAVRPAEPLPPQAAYEMARQHLVQQRQQQHQRQWLAALSVKGATTEQ